MVVYSSDFNANLNLQAELIEKHVGQQVFDFIFGKEELMDEKFKIKDSRILANIGVSQGTFLMVGIEKDGFCGFENVALPLNYLKNEDCEGSLESL